MAEKIVQHRRKTASEWNSYTGPVAELVFDTTNKTFRAMDGAQAGGFLLPRLNANGRLLLGGSTDNGHLVRLEATSKHFGLTYPSVTTWEAEVDSTGRLKLSKDGSEKFRINQNGFSKFSNNGTFQFAGLDRYEFNSNQDTAACSFASSNTGSSTIVFETHLNSGAAGRHIAAQLNGAAVMQVLANGNLQNTNNSYGAISDVRFKENIKEARSYLLDFMKVRHVTFNHIGYFEKQFGVVAQEIEKVFPGLIEEVPAFDKNGTDTGETRKTVKYSVLAQIQGKVLQEVFAKHEKDISDLKCQIEELQKTVKKLLK